MFQALSSVVDVYPNLSMKLIFGRDSFKIAAFLLWNTILRAHLIVHPVYNPP